MSEHIITKLYDVMQISLSVSALLEVCQELVNQGFGEYAVGYRIGRTEDGMALSFPVASLIILADGSNVLFSPVPVKQEAEQVVDFDTIVKINEDSLTISVVDYSQETGEE